MNDCTRTLQDEILAWMAITLVGLVILALIMFLITAGYSILTHESD